jgi:8-oxo-dGTP diphosphatase
MTFTYKYPQIAVTVDIILFTKEKEDIFVLLIQRGNPPFENMWAFPGGFVEINETLEDAAMRELKEETGITGIKLIQFSAFGAIDRDPRQRTISVVFTGFVPSKNIYYSAADDAKNVAWFNIKEIDKLAFDHSGILEKAVNDLLC